MKKVKIILGSGSASRKQQLKDLGFVFDVQVSGVDEDFYKKQIGKKNCSPKEVCLKIAQAKVAKVAKNYPEALVLGGDQMPVLNNSRILSKSNNPAQAISTLKALQGKTHILLTALSMCYQKKTFSYLESNKMTMRKLSLSQIQQYVQMSKPFGCSGAYALERYGICLFESIQTTDQSAVIGFPVLTLINQMRKWNIPIPCFDKTTLKR